MLRRLAAPAARLAHSKRQWVPPWPASARQTGRPESHAFSTASPHRNGATVGSFQRGYTGGFELTFLGTSSQGGACRYPSSLALRLRGSSSSEVWIFDAGEGCIAQLQRSYMRVGAVHNIFITHVHGDHLYGLPGLVLSVLSRRHTDGVSATAAHPQPPLRVYGPPGIRNFLRMALGVASSTLPLKDALQINELVFPADFGPASQRFRCRRSQPYWKSGVRALPFELAARDFAPVEDPLQPGQFTYTLIGGDDEEDADDGDTRRTAKQRAAGDRFEGDGAPATVVAAPVLHTVPCLAYTVRENVIARRFDKSKLARLGVPTNSDTSTRELFQAWLRGESAPWQGALLTPDDVMTDGRRGRSLCVVGDTHDASGAAHIARDVDVLVHEATNLAAQTHTARKRGHSSTRGATAFAKRVAAKRLLLNHTSVAYSEPKLRVLEAEARALFGVDRVYVARDLSVFNIPTQEEDDDNFVFRRFVGFTSAADCARQRGLVANADGELVSDDQYLAFPPKHTFPDTAGEEQDPDVQDPDDAEKGQTVVDADVRLGGVSPGPPPGAGLEAEEGTGAQRAAAAIR